MTAAGYGVVVPVHDEPGADAGELARALAVGSPDALAEIYRHWSSLVHAVIMAVQALTDGAERWHLIGDVPALLVVAIVLAALTPRDRVARC